MRARRRSGPQRGPDEPLRVLQVLAQDAVGGTELHVALLAERLGGEGIACDVATFFPPGPIAERLARHGLVVRSLGGAGRLTAVRRLGRLLRAGRYSVVEAYGFKASTIVRLVVRAVTPGTRFVCGVQGLHITEVDDVGELKGRFALVVERALTRLVDAYEANSQGAIGLLARHGIEGDRIRYIPNAVDLVDWRPGGRPLAEREAVVLCSARFVSRKRQEDLIRALASMRSRGDEIRLVLAGDGPTRPECERLCAALGVSDAVAFVGNLTPEAVRSQLEESVVFALVSVWEGMPAAVLEAMASGVPVVGTRVNGTADLVEDGLTGRLVEPRDPDALAGALGELLGDRPTAARLGAEARRRAEGEYGIGTMVSRKATLYREVLGR